MFELITPAEMSRADRLTIESGISGIGLMETAGRQIVKVIQKSFPQAGHVLCVCGTGNNGGDGLVVARLLRESGLHADVFIAGDMSRIHGDAKLALEKLDSAMLKPELPEIENYDLVLDALLGAGLDRDVEGELADIIKQINASGKLVVSADLPSGIDGKSGAVRGVAVQATASVTFFCQKPGHVLVPGRFHCGDLHLVQIGIKPSTLQKIQVDAVLNSKGLWHEHYPKPLLDGHKYNHGHTLVISGHLTNTGASRLTAAAALRVGSGLVTLASPKDALIVNASHLTSIMLSEANSPQDISNILRDKRFNCVALGPGLSPDEETCELVEAVLNEDRMTVLDAGALSCFEMDAERLFAAIRKKQTATVLTPHEGEFARLFPYESCAPSKIERARNAAKLSGAVVVLKGPDTVVATPEGQVSVSNNAPPWLATAGSGDVLSGIIAGLLSQDMPTFYAASAGVWMHGEAAKNLGPGMISSDMDYGLKLVVKSMLEHK